MIWRPNIKFTIPIGDICEFAKAAATQIALGVETVAVTGVVGAT